MKKPFLTLIAIIGVTLSAQAIPLFPFFCDVAGDYKDGTPANLSALGITTTYYRQTPNLYSTLKEADDFLNEVMPYSSENISRTENIVLGQKIITYISPMSDGKIATIYLYETIENKFEIAYSENDK